MSMDILLYSGPPSSGEIVKEMLGAKYDVRVVEPEPEALLPIFELCSIFLDASMKVPVARESIGRAENLKLIVTATTGASHIDQNALAERGIPLLTLKGQPILKDLTAAAEHSWLLLMACARKLRGATYNVQEGEWRRSEFPGIMLKGKMLGIIGYGRIGSWMARYATAFGMNVQAYDPFVEKHAEGVELVEFDVLLATSDIISVHVHLSPETAGMISQEKIRMCKRGCIFINTSRGELVDEAALVEGLRQGHISAAGVDVLIGEPHPSDSLLWRYSKESPNVIITPHIGGFCPESVDKVIRYSCERILGYGI